MLKGEVERGLWQWEGGQQNVGNKRMRTSTGEGTREENRVKRKEGGKRKRNRWEEEWEKKDGGRN